MPADLFSAPGISTWQQRLNQSPRFAEAAADWHGRLVLIADDGDGAGRRTWIVVGHGRCAEARPGSPADDADADFVFSASDATWSDLVAARCTPATAALLGRLKLLKGDVLALVPHARAAAELLAAAAHGAA